MRCLITLETRPCEDAINSKVLLLPIKLTIIKNIRLFALPMYKGLTVRTQVQGKHFAINLVENVKETSLFLPLSPACQSKALQGRNCPNWAWQHWAHHVPASTEPACRSQPYCSNTSMEKLFQKESRVFFGENIYNSEAVMSGGNCIPTHSPQFRRQKGLKMLKISPYLTNKIHLQFFYLWNHRRKQWSNSPQAPCKLSSQGKNPFL